MFLPIFTIINVYLIILLGLIAIVGDYIVHHVKLHLFQAFFDNVTHALIGALSWFIVCLNLRTTKLTIQQKLFEVFCCGLLASIIDIDHFIAARSLSLKDAINLDRRPILHCSTFPFSFGIILLFYGWLFQSITIKRVSLIVLTAFASHHCRDATRRGFWFYPFGSTRPIPYLIYVSLTCLLPYLIYFTDTLIMVESTYKLVPNKGSAI